MKKILLSPFTPFIPLILYLVYNMKLIITDKDLSGNVLNPDQWNGAGTGFGITVIIIFLIIIAKLTGLIIRETIKRFRKLKE